MSRQITVMEVSPRDGLQNEGAEEHLYPLLNPDRQQAVVDFCREYGVIKESPVYDISRTDHVLYEKGITTKKQLKLRALGDAGMRPRSTEASWSSGTARRPTAPATWWG